jgi:ATP adenylyltransferase
MKLRRSGTLPASRLDWTARLFSTAQPLYATVVERIYTPWRSAYVTTADAATGCFLCEKPREDADERNLIVARAERVYAILNLYPYNTGHVMVAPYEHGGDLAALDTGTSAALMTMSQRIVAALREEYHPDAFNLGMNLGRPAGAGVPDHLHMHIVPRWSGDTNFMPVLAETKVLPESIEQTYARVRARLQAMPDAGFE